MNADPQDGNRSAAEVTSVDVARGAAALEATGAALRELINLARRDLSHAIDELEMQLAAIGGSAATGYVTAVDDRIWRIASAKLAPLTGQLKALNARLGAITELAAGEAHEADDGKMRDRLAMLTRRERDVMELVVASQTNRAIAEQLGISPRTVESHRAAVMKKTGARSLAELLILFLAAG